MKIETTGVYYIYSKCFDAKLLRIFRRQMRGSWNKYKNQPTGKRCFDRHWAIVLRKLSKEHPEVFKISRGESNALFDKAFSLPIVQVSGE